MNLLPTVNVVNSRILVHSVCNLWNTCKPSHRYYFVRNTHTNKIYTKWQFRSDRYLWLIPLSHFLKENILHTWECLWSLEIIFMSALCVWIVTTHKWCLCNNRCWWLVKYNGCCMSLDNTHKMVTFYTYLDSMGKSTNGFP